MARPVSKAIPARVRQKGTYDRRDKWGTKKYGTSAAQRKSVLARDQYTCVYCGAKATQVDHIKPVYHGGASNPRNLVAACAPCNRAKGALWDCEHIRILAASDHKNAGAARAMLRGVEARQRFAAEWNEQFDGEARPP